MYFILNNDVKKAKILLAMSVSEIFRLINIIINKNTREIAPINTNK
jgi:hypothetical protein